MTLIEKNNNTGVQVWKIRLRLQPAQVPISSTSCCQPTYLAPKAKFTPRTMLAFRKLDVLAHLCESHQAYEEDRETTACSATTADTTKVSVLFSPAPLSRGSAV